MDNSLACACCGQNVCDCDHIVDVRLLVIYCLTHNKSLGKATPSTQALRLYRLHVGELKEFDE